MTANKSDGSRETEFVNVPVPRHLVMEVMKMLTELDLAERGNAKAAPHKSATEPTSGGGDIPWTKEDLRVIWDNREEFSSVSLMARMMSFLASKAPQPVPRDEIGVALGMDGQTLYKSLGRFTVFAANRVGREKEWPLVFPGNGWALTPETAADWTSIVEEASEVIDHE